MKVRHSYGIRLASLLLLSLALAGCSWLQMRNAESPRVSVADIALAGLSVFEQRFDVTLRLQNPNDFALPITGFEYALNLNGEEFASGVNATDVTLPALGEELVTVTLNSDVINSIQRLRRWRREGTEALDYEFSGQLRLANAPVRLPFKYSGQVDLRIPKDEP